MKTWLLWAALLPCRLAAAQVEHAAVVPPLPESSLHASVSTTTVHNVPGVRYQYQLVHFNNQQVRLAPAWHGQIKLEPARKLFNPDADAELDGLLLKTINELSAEGWELLEIRTETQPTSAVQQVERDLQFNDPQRPVYKATTSVSASSSTRYLFRKAL
ncbi:hypothetical protein [Hymenobacter properus]|uniref:DUF4177 domain-containing protein n=1 Tax=Hymenobacter properus TaxID=2791026 RepID=A0A931FIW1_9BACT|nr:hypothetical protein [Hymenobacter properus]MBF9141223.1 hypothetical protein [Hymenobacter properus]MBR7720032.1 hypothetical protein [Microvirga sp. SRT04]